MEHEVRAMGERAEEADVEVISIFFGLEGPVGSDFAVEGVVWSGVPGGGEGVGVGGGHVGDGTDGCDELVQTLEHWEGGC